MYQLISFLEWEEKQNKRIFSVCSFSKRKEKGEKYLPRIFHGVCFQWLHRLKSNSSSPHSSEILQNVNHVQTEKTRLSVWCICWVLDCKLPLMKLSSFLQNSQLLCMDLPIVYGPKREREREDSNREIKFKISTFFAALGNPIFRNFWICVWGEFTFIIHCFS